MADWKDRERTGLTVGVVSPALPNGVPVLNVLPTAAPKGVRSVFPNRNINYLMIFGQPNSIFMRVTGVYIYQLTTATVHIFQHDSMGVKTQQCIVMHLKVAIPVHPFEI